MMRKILSLLLSFVLVCACLPACGSDSSEDVEATEQTSSSKTTLKSGLDMKVSRTGEVQMTRSKSKGSKPDAVEDGTWTVFVYLCGSDLESDGGNATRDLSEMVGASGSENVSFVVQTGGASRWESDGVDANRMQRFLIRDGSIMEVDSVAVSNMGDANTLADFLTWGVKEYPAANMGVILWNHGGGSLWGVCFDELNDDDAIMLDELDAALLDVQDVMWEKFEFIGFDACLMCTLEAANVLASYANYLVASEESEPDAGWDYATIIEYLAKNPEAGGKDVGKVIADSFYESVGSDEEGDIATLAVVDLSKVDAIVTAFNSFAANLFEASQDDTVMAEIVRGIHTVDNYGGNNRSEGYFNMVDLAGLAEACAKHAKGADEVAKAVDSAVTYKISGPMHEAARGLSTYYPLQITSEELQAFERVCVSPGYLSFVDRIAHGNVYEAGTEYTEYSDNKWFSLGDLWDWALSISDDDYWSYAENTSEDGDSKVITFAEELQLGEDGVYWFKLDKNGINNAESVEGIVYVLSDDGKDYIELGETYDVYGDWDTGKFSDGFDGMWLSLPDGQNLALHPDATTDNSVVYCSPITLNGEETYLRISQNMDNGSVTVEGTWAGQYDSGASARVEPLKDGDVIVPEYYAFSVDENSDEEALYYGEEYKVEGKLTVSYGYLMPGEYLYTFCINDIFGNYLITDPFELDLDENGDIYY